MPTVREQASQKVSTCFVLGLLLFAAGVGLAASKVPHTDTSAFSDGRQEGDAVTFFLGVAMSSFGSLLMSVALIAWGVSLGMRMTRDE